jgi:hypothetical protein
LQSKDNCKTLTFKNPVSYNIEPYYLMDKAANI